MNLHEINPLAQDKAVPVTRRGRRSGNWFFLRDTHGGATTVMVGMVAAVTVGASALVVDHVWLVDQRDVLKTASDAAAVATTIEMERNGERLTDVQLQARIQEIAEAYVELNMEYLDGNDLDGAKDSLAVQTVSDRNRRTVDVTVNADLGGTLLSRHLPITANYEGPESTETDAQVESVLTPIEVVLAIDTSSSMYHTVRGTNATPNEGSRMDFVKAAAKQLVGILKPNAHDKIAVGVVPWSTFIRLDSAAVSLWEANNWAQYPSSRQYAVPYTCSPSGRCTAPPQRDMLPARTTNTAWKGCLDEHRVFVGGNAALPLAKINLGTPHRFPFAQAFFPSQYGYAYNCTSDPAPANFDGQSCYAQKTDSVSGVIDRRPAQENCDKDTPFILPLSTDPVTINKAIDGLEAVGSSTYSSLGILWGQRMLTPGWKSVWGGTVHPVDNTVEAHKDTRKIIVLLTDGEDNQCGYNDPLCESNNLGVGRTDACTMAKGAGTRIYIVAAMHPDLQTASLVDALEECSSERDDPDNHYVFLSNDSGEDIKSSFVHIAKQLQAIRRVH